MNKQFLLIFILLSFITTLNAEYLRTIRIGSFVQEKDAKESLLKIQEFIQEHENIIVLKNENDFEFGVRKSGKYYITHAEPFRDREVLQQVLDTLRLKYDDIYVTKLKQDKVYPKQLRIIPEIETPQKEQKLSLSETTQAISSQKKTDTEKKDIFNKESVLEEESVSEDRNISDVVAKEEVVEKNDNNKESIFWKYLFFIALLVILFFIRLRILTQREIEKLTTKEMITQSKLSQMIPEMKKKEEFLSYVSHELRTPMTAIIGLTHLVLENKLSKTQHEYVQKIESSAQYLLNILNDILDISKLQEGQVTIEKNEFNLNDTLEYVIDIIATQAKQNNVAITLDIEDGIPPMIIGDSLRLGQVLINLLSNSVKFTKDGDVKLTVKKLSSFGESVTLDFIVSDTGIGMTEEQIKGIFESYSQADESISRKFGGTGLGLAISKQLVELMNGKIKVESKKDEGSIFSFYIDFMLKDSQNRRNYRLPSSKLLGKRILIIESLNTNVILLSRYLTYFKYKVNSIPSFEEVALEKKFVYDIIIINQLHVTKNALAIIEEIQKTHELKIVLLKELYSSMHNSKQDALIIDATIKIPFTQQNILNMITELYIEKKSDTQLRKINLKDKLKDIEDKNILLVDDNMLNHKVISGLLANTKINLTFATNGKEAIDLIFKNLSYDLVLMDINMPIMNGYEATKEIRKHKQYNRLPILALTADVMEDSIDKALSSGMQGYITKPIIIDIFYKKIFDMLNHNHDAKEYIKPLEISQSDGFEELSISIGLSRCNEDKFFYKSILEDFKTMYANSFMVIEELCKEGKFKEARAKAMDIKDISLNIGAYSLCEHAAAMEYEFEKGNRSEWKSLLRLYLNSLEKLFKEIDKYIKDS